MRFTRATPQKNEPLPTVRWEGRVAGATVWGSGG